MLRTSVRDADAGRVAEAMCGVTVTRGCDQ
jgi:hypothetical protein